MDKEERKYYKRMDLSLADPEGMRVVAHALSTELRLKILALIGEKSCNVIEIAAALDVPVSTTAINVSVLEQANLIMTEQVSGIRGLQKRCNRVTDSVSINLTPPSGSQAYTGVMTMPVGAYSRCEGIQPSCGLAGHDDYIGLQDDPLYFYATERFNAQLVWFHSGFVEYRFPVIGLDAQRLNMIEISFEACSETIGYDNDYRSDISLIINGITIGSWLSPGDFGGRRGMLNPDWWGDFASQFGMLKNWRISREGSFLDNIPISNIKLQDLDIQQAAYLSVSIGVSPDATHVGGVNLFGRGFGDIPQDILLRHYST